jgi:hypothetical protein
MKITPSKHQLAIFDHIQNSKNNLLVQACAGSGKTTTILGCLELIPPSESVLLLAFNKSIVETLVKRAPTTADIKTFNSVGNSLVTRYMGKVTLSPNKVREIVYSYGLEKETGEALIKIIELCKRLNIALDGGCATLLTPEIMEYIISRFGIPVPKTFNREKLFSLVSDGLLRNIYMAVENKIIDYDDQVFLPIYRGWESVRYDWVFVDEAQDISPIRTALLEKHLKHDARMIAVGDKCHPVGTKVTRYSKNGERYETNIEDLEIGDMVTTYRTHDCAFRNQGNVVNGKTIRPFEGELVIVTTISGEESRYTPNHICLANFESHRNKHAVYLMRKGNQYRIGKCSMSYHRASGLSARMRSESAEAIWLLDLYDTENEAFFWEQAISGKFGIPQLMFDSSKMNREHAHRLLSKAWEFIGDNSDRANVILRYYKRDINYPLFDIKNKAQMTMKRPILVRACNLIDGTRVLPFKKDRTSTHVRKIEWEEIKISYAEYRGDVVSLDVSGNSLYVADNIVTHNCQAIYGFTGSTARAMDELKSKFNCDQLPLSVSYRCPVAVVTEAAKLVPVIEHAENAEEGSVTDLTQIEAKIKISTLSEYDIILCRTNAPLSALAWKLIQARIPVSILGRDIGKNLMVLIDSFRTNDIIEMTTKLKAWLNLQLSKYADNEMMQSNVLDRYQSIMCFAEDSLDVPSMKRTIEELFSDDLSDSKLVLSSIHKSKGMEFNNVAILNPELIPIKYAKQDWQLEQERNLKYVAITRAIKSLVYFKDTQLTSN